MRDMHLASLNVLRFVEDTTREQFLENTEKQYAVLHALQMIGEAVAHVSEGAKEQLRDIPWQDIRGMRNRLTHEYFAVNLVIVWETAVRDIPPLIDLLQPHVDAPDEPLLGPPSEE